MKDFAPRQGAAPNDTATHDTAAQGGAPTGPAPKVRRAQSAIDIVTSVLMAMMLWPFPVARATLSPVAHVGGVLVTCVIVQFLYFAVCVVVWRKTLGMHLAGISLRSADGGAPSRRESLAWALISAAIAPWYVVSPTSASVASLAERSSHTTVY